MFDDQTNNSAQTMGGPAPTPSIGLGINPNPTFVAPASSSPTPPPVTPPVDETPAAPASISTTHHNGTAVDPDAPVAETEESAAPEPQVTHTSAPAGSLEDIKVQALSQLSPLVNQLEQTPEEKYKTLMMMIQASDNQNLISEAYEAAQGISDEKARAEALLNIVNEINYFTTQHNS